MTAHTRRRPALKRGSVGWAWSTIALILSGITTWNTPPKNAHAASNPAMTDGRSWRKTEMHKAVPAIDSGEDQGMHHAGGAGSRVGQQAHPPEVNLAFRAGLAVSDPDRRLPRTAAVAQNFPRVTVQCPFRNDHAAAGQQFTGPDHRQALIQQALQFLAVLRQQRPAPPVTVGAVRADPLRHGTDQLIDSCPSPPDRSSPQACAAST